MATYRGHQEDSSGNLLLPTPHSLVPSSSIELGSTASQAYTKGSYLVFNNGFYRATTAIAKGNTLQDGTNLSGKSVGGELNSIRNEIYLNKSVLTHQNTGGDNTFFSNSWMIGYVFPIDFYVENSVANAKKLDDNMYYAPLYSLSASQFNIMFDSLPLSVGQDVPIFRDSYGDNATSTVFRIYRDSSGYYMVNNILRANSVSELNTLVKGKHYFYNNAGLIHYKYSEAINN